MKPKRNVSKMFPFLVLAVLLTWGQALGLTINFDWDRNAEPDMSHYVMYRCPNGADCAVGSARLAVGTIPHPGSEQKVTWSYVFTPPPGTEEIQYFAITAVDQSGNESGPSNIVSTRIDNKPPAPPTGPLRIIGILP